MPWRKIKKIKWYKFEMDGLFKSVWPKSNRGSTVKCKISINLILNTWVHELSSPHVPNRVQLGFGLPYLCPLLECLMRNSVSHFAGDPFPSVESRRIPYLITLESLKKDHRALCHGLHKDVHCLRLHGSFKVITVLMLWANPSFFIVVIPKVLQLKFQSPIIQIFL